MAGHHPYPASHSSSPNLIAFPDFDAGFVEGLEVPSQYQSVRQTQHANYPQVGAFQQEPVYTPYYRYQHHQYVTNHHHQYVANHQTYPYQYSDAGQYGYRSGFSTP